MREAYFVVGPEGSGTRLLTRALIAAGCTGDAGHEQRMDNLLFRGQLAPIVFRRSVPHAGDWPNLAGIAGRMMVAGYHVTALVTARDRFAMARAQVRAKQVANLDAAYRQIEHAMQIMFDQLRGLPIVIVPYEAAALHGCAMRTLLRDLGLDLRTLRFAVPGSPEPVYDGNAKHYVSGLVATGLNPPLLEILVAAGYVTMADLAQATDEALLAVPGIGPGCLAAIRKACGAEQKSSSEYAH